MSAPALVAILCAGLLLPHPALAAVQGFRGDLSGRFPDATPPAVPGPGTLAWQAGLGGWGNGSPVVAGGRVFVTAEPYTLLALDAATGRELWRRTVSRADAYPGAAGEKLRADLARLEAARTSREELAARSVELRREVRRKRTADARAALAALSARLVVLDSEITALEQLAPRIHSMVGTASATPVTDGQRVCTCWGNFVVACHDLDGKLLWARDVHDEEFAREAYAMVGHHEGQAASPWIWRDRLVVPLGRLQALDLATGRTLWTHRPYRDFGTVALVSAGGSEFVATPSGGLVRLSDGQELAPRAASIRYVAPMAVGDILYFVGGLDPHRTVGSAVRVKPPPAAPETLWKEEWKLAEPFAGTLVDGDRLWMASYEGELTIISRQDGSVLHRNKLPFGHESPYASPALAGSGVWFIAQDGQGVVLEREPPFGARSRFAVGEQVRASPLFVGKRLYVRGLHSLFAFEAR